MKEDGMEVLGGGIAGETEEDEEGATAVGGMEAADADAVGKGPVLSGGGRSDVVEEEAEADDPEEAEPEVAGAASLAPEPGAEPSGIIGSGMPPPSSAESGETKNRIPMKKIAAQNTERANRLILKGGVRIMGSSTRILFQNRVNPLILFFLSLRLETDSKTLERLN